MRWLRYRTVSYTHLDVYKRQSVDNAIANVSLSTPISEKAIFVAKQYDEDSEYFDNAIGAVMNWAGQNNLALTEAVVYDLHFENERCV